MYIYMYICKYVYMYICKFATFVVKRLKKASAEIF